MTGLGRIQRVLGARRFMFVAALLGVLLVAPSIGGGMQTEDWVFRDIARAYPLTPSTFNLWGWDQRLPKSVLVGRVHLQRQMGLMPWVTSDAFSVSFWRPLASLTHRVGYWLWPRSPLLMHVQNVLWFALLIVAAGLVYRRLLERAWVAGLATLLYAVDDAHGHAVGWISNRNALIGAAFALLALWLHDRWRRDGSRAAAWLAPLALALGLLGSELALGVVGFLIAHAVLLDPATRRRRIVASLPWLSVVTLWALAYRALGHGVSGSGMYIDPVRAPAQFVSTGVARAFVLLASAFAGPPADLYNRLSSLWPAALASVAVLAVVAVVIGGALRRDRVARFLALGTVLSVAPACAVFPEDRLLLLVGAGAMALIARFTQAVAERGAVFRGARVAVAVLGVVHLGVAPLLLPFRALTMQRYEARVARARESAFSLPRSMKQELVVLDAPDFYFATMMLLTRISTGHMPSPTLTVAGTLGPVRITRIDEKTVDVRPDGGFLSRTFDRIYRDQSHPMHVGEIVSAPGSTIRVLEVGTDGAPLAARFTFHWSLESARLVFTKWHGGRYVRVQMPAIGQSLVVP